MKKALLTLSLLLMGLIRLSAQHCPVNFDSKTLKSAKKQVEEWGGRIIAFDAKVIQVQKGHQDKPYYQVEIPGGRKLWVGSLVKSGYEQEGGQLRILGYFTKVKNDAVAATHNPHDYHVLAFGIINVGTKQLAMVPGSERQIKQWVEGTVPVAEN